MEFVDSVQIQSRQLYAIHIAHQNLPLSVHNGHMMPNSLKLPLRLLWIRVQLLLGMKGFVKYEGGWHCMQKCTRITLGPDITPSTPRTRYIPGYLILILLRKSPPPSGILRSIQVHGFRQDFLPRGNKTGFCLVFNQSRSQSSSLLLSDFERLFRELFFPTLQCSESDRYFYRYPHPHPHSSSFCRRG